MGEQMRGIDVFFGQEAASQPQALPRASHSAKGLPVVVQCQIDAGIPLLTEHVWPLPGIQLTQDGHGTKLGVAHDRHRYTLRYQVVYISEQSQLLDGRTMSALAFDPCPDDGDRATAIRHRDHQQLVMKTDLAAVHDQTYVPVLRLTL